jgi:Flp pilus assembly protein TadG
VRFRDDSGSAAAEFVMVCALLTLLTLGVVQLGLLLLVRNTLVDAAAEGARFGALADNTPVDGVARTADLISTALGQQYAGDVTASTGDYLGRPAVIVTVRAPVPLVGLFGPTTLEVTGHAAVETVR